MVRVMACGMIPELQKTIDCLLCSALAMQAEISGPESVIGLVAAQSAPGKPRCPCTRAELACGARSSAEMQPVDCQALSAVVPEER